MVFELSLPIYLSQTPHKAGATLFTYASNALRRTFSVIYSRRRALVSPVRATILCVYGVYNTHDYYDHQNKEYHVCSLLQYTLALNYKRVAGLLDLYLQTSGLVLEDDCLFTELRYFCFAAFCSAEVYLCAFQELAGLGQLLLGDGNTLLGVDVCHQSRVPDVVLFDVVLLLQSRECVQSGLERSLELCKCLSSHCLVLRCALYQHLPLRDDLLDRLDLE